jgi:hypothetical protein
MKANLTHCPAVHVYMHERGLWPAKKPLGIMLRMTLPVSGLPPFLALPSPRAADGLLCEGARFPSPRPHVAIAIVSRTNGAPMTIIKS